MDITFLYNPGCNPKSFLAHHDICFWLQCCLDSTDAETLHDADYEDYAYESMDEIQDTEDDPTDPTWLPPETKEESVNLCELV